MSVLKFDISNVCGGKGRGKPQANMYYTNTRLMNKTQSTDW